MAHTFNPSRSRWISGSEANLVYRVSYKAARATEKPCLTQNKNPQNKKKFSLQVSYKSFIYKLCPYTKLTHNGCQSEKAKLIK